MAAGATYEPIATTTLSSAAANINFFSIAASWTDLRLVLSFSLAAADFVLYSIQSGSPIISSTRLQGNGTTATSSRILSETFVYPSNVNIAINPQALFTTDIFSYSGSTYKTALTTISADTNGSGYTASAVSLMQTTAAINQLNIITNQGSNFNIGTTATLYGIKAA